MNILIDPLFIFIYLLIMLYARVPNIDDENFIKHKMYLFACIFLFDIVLQTMKRIKSKCIIKMGNVLFDSLKTATAGIIGYSIYTDLLNMDFDMGNDRGRLYRLTIVALTIVTFITLIRIAEMILIPRQLDCDY